MKDPAKMAKAAELRKLAEKQLQYALEEEAGGRKASAENLLGEASKTEEAAAKEAAAA